MIDVTCLTNEKTEIRIKYLEKLDIYVMYIGNECSIYLKKDKLNELKEAINSVDLSKTI